MADDLVAPFSLTDDNFFRPGVSIVILWLSSSASLTLVITPLGPGSPLVVGASFQQLIQFKSPFDMSECTSIGVNLY